MIKKRIDKKVKERERKRKKRKKKEKEKEIKKKGKEKDSPGPVMVSNTLCPAVHSILKLMQGSRPEGHGVISIRPSVF